MKQPAKFGLLVVAVLLSNAIGITQAQVSGEVGRGFPYSSGPWSDLIYVAIGGIILFSLIAIVIKLWDVFWHVVSRLSKWRR